MEINIEMLADVLADKINASAAVPTDKRLWGIKDIMTSAGLSRSYVDRMTRRPDFPTAIRLPGANGAGFAKWKASEVWEWFENFRDKEAVL